VSEFLQRVAATVQKWRLLPRGQKILVAVSGGADSLVLLHTLHALAEKSGWKISVAHFNHRLRGRASAADEALVRRTARKMSLPFYCGSGDVAAFAHRSKISVEMAARKLRHEFLARTARRRKISVVALAHHADDQVELFFLRLLRGAGGEGLAGMKRRAPSPADRRITLVRPLRDFSKAELLAFAGENKIRFRDDATNFSTDFLRSRIRTELLPLLREKYQSGLAKTVLRLMEITGAESAFAGAAAQEWRKHRRAAPAGGERGFETLPVAVQRKILQSQLTEGGVAPDFELIEQLRESAGKFVSVRPGFAVARDATGKLVSRKNPPNGFAGGELKLKLAGRAGAAEFDGVKFRWQIAVPKKFLPPQRRAGIEVFDADKIGGEITLRHWRPGDRFQPIGLKSPAKLQDLFVNAKIPAAQRRKLVLATAVDGEIFWVDGLRMAEKFKLTPPTRRRLVWRWR